MGGKTVTKIKEVIFLRLYSLHPCEVVLSRVVWLWPCLWLIDFKCN